VGSGQIEDQQVQCTYYRRGRPWVTRCPLSGSGRRGTIGIADADNVDLSNLQRQIIHFTEDVGTPKVTSAARKLKALNPEVQVVEYQEFLNAANIADIIREYDFVVDGTDNFASKFLINDACVLEGIPLFARRDSKIRGQTINGQASRNCLLPLPLQ